MKTIAHIHRPPARLRPMLPWLALCALAASPALAAPGAAAPEPKTHTLFMGADIDIKVGSDFCRVRDVNGDAFIVIANGAESSVPMDKGLLSLKVQQSLKLTEASATIADLKSNRVYTSANDPRKKFSREQPGLFATASVDAAGGAMITARSTLGPFVQGAGGAGGLSGMAAAGASDAAKSQIASIDNSFRNVAGDQFSEANNIGNYVGKMQAELDKELFDAMEIHFKVFSGMPLSRPYAVIIARYHEKDINPPKFKNWIFAKALQPVDTKPQIVHIIQGGFPLGFVIDDFKVHLFDRGQELATNVADRRVELTYGDAFKYVLLDYLGAHKGASLAAAPVMGQLPPGWRSRLTADQLAKACFVKVSKDGMPLGAFTDEACTQPVADPALEAVVQEIRFTPTLDHGKAVEGSAKLHLGDIRI